MTPTQTTTVKQPNFRTELKARELMARGMGVRGIVLHDTAGSGTHNDTLYLAHPGDGRKVSVDFTAERDGSLWKLNPDLRAYATKHGGRNTSFKGLHNGQVTRATIGIEICQHVGLKLSPVYPQEQVRAVAHLCAWLCEEFKLNPGDITTHRNIVTDGSRSDPRQFPFEGENGFWFHFWDVQGKGEFYLNSIGIRKTPVLDHTERQHAVEPGESFYGIARKFNVKPDALATANDLTLKSVLVPGQILQIP